MVRRTDDDRVELGPLEQLAIIAKYFRVRKPVTGLLEVSGIDVAERDDVFRGNGEQIIEAAVADADGGDAQRRARLGRKYVRHAKHARHGRRQRRLKNAPPRDRKLLSILAVAGAAVHEPCSA